MGLTLVLEVEMAEEKWIAYERYGRGTDKSIVVKAATEKRPMGFSTERPATKTEIAAEKRRRQMKERYAQRVEAFRSRPEYKDAQLIASTLELMDIDNNPLDVLTPDEWRELRERICGK